MRRLLDQILRPLIAVARFVYGERPRRPERNPLEFMLFVTLALANFRIALGTQPLPKSLAQTPDIFGQGSAILFVGGAVIAAAGLAWPDEDYRLLIEQLGLAFLGFGLLCYGAALINANTIDNGLPPASLSWGVALGTGARFAQIWWFFRQRGERR